MTESGLERAIAWTPSTYLKKEKAAKNDRSNHSTKDPPQTLQGSLFSMPCPRAIAGESSTLPDELIQDFTFWIGRVEVWM